MHSGTAVAQKKNPVLQCLSFSPAQVAQNSEMTESVRVTWIRSNVSVKHI